MDCVVGLAAWQAGTLWSSLLTIVGWGIFLACRGCLDGRSSDAEEVCERESSAVAAMQFIKSQKERPRRCVTISHSPVLISDAARGGGHLSVGTPHCPLDRSALSSRILAGSGVGPYLRYAGVNACVPDGEVLEAPWSCGKMPQSKPCPLQGITRNPHFQKQATPYIARGPESPSGPVAASCSSSLASNFTGYPLHPLRVDQRLPRNRKWALATRAEWVLWRWDSRAPESSKFTIGHTLLHC